MILALDVGATHIKSGVVKNDKLEDKTDFETPKNFEEFLKLLEEITSSYKNIDTLSIAIAGQVDMKKGILKHAPNLGWKNINFVELVQNRLKRRIVLINDVRAITYGEYVYGGLRGVENGACIFVGTGIGGGVIIDKELRFGCDSNLGEIGHIKLKPNGLKCTCGKRGCFEAYAGGLSLEKYLKKLGYNKSLKDLASDKESKVAKKVFDRFVLYMSYGLASLINMLNPCKIVLGGGVMMGFDFLFEEIKSKAISLAINPSVENINIELSKLGNDAGILGAYAFALKHT
ncbi:MAG: ROK family protein [Hydrogenobaculum sp.]|nr:MAG: ROK family protein [Hydrogenobaculum sp.]